MTTRIEKIEAILDGQIDNLLTVVQAGPKVTYNVDGKNYNWTEYQAMLQDAIDKTRALLLSEQGPGEVIISGDT